MSNPHSVTGSESEFEFIETPKAPTPTFEKFEECGVRTTSVGASPRLKLPTRLDSEDHTLLTTEYSTLLSRMDPFLPTAPDPKASRISW